MRSPCSLEGRSTRERGPAFVVRASSLHRMSSQAVCKLSFRITLPQLIVPLHPINVLL